MKISKTYKYKLRLNATQSIAIDRMISHCRYLYNVAKECREWAYKSYGKKLNYYDLANELPQLKKQEEWLKEVPAQTLQDVLERQEKAFKSFFEGRSSYPRWAKKGKYNSITFKSVSPESHNRIKLPKIGSVKYFASRIMEGDLKRATIIKECDGYYVCITSVQNIIPKLSSIDESQAVGLDMGISYFAVTSDGEFIENPRFLKSTLPKLRREQRSLSRKVKRSKNWYKQLVRVQRLHKKLSNQRRDFLHKHSTRIVKNNTLISVEKLNIKGMVRSRLGQSISDVAWGEFQRQLEYKSKWRGKTFLKVDAKYTSQECSSCGHISKENRLTQSQFKCINCGHEANADFDASKVILGRAMSNVTKRKAVA